MPPSPNLNTYSDVRRVLDTAVARGGLRYKCKSPGAATNFRQRAYTYRSLLQKQAEATVGNIPGYQPGTPYDNFVFVVQGVFVIIKEREPEGEMLDLEDDTPVNEELGPSTIEDLDPLIQQFRKMVDPND